MGGTINVVAVIAAAVINMVLGALWYSPIMFGKVWMKLKKIKDPKSLGNPTPAYIVSFLVAIVLAYTLAWVLAVLGIYQPADGMAIALLMWLGFGLAIMVPMAMFEKLNGKLVSIYLGYQLVHMLIIGAMLSVWR